MKFKIMGRKEIEGFCTDIKHIVISVRDSGAEDALLPRQLSRMATLYLEFDDLEKEYKDYMIFSKEDAREILAFFNNFRCYVNLIIVNCEAGISRSAGIVAALSKISGQDDSIFFKKYLPNMLVYKTILEEYHSHN